MKLIIILAISIYVIIGVLISFNFVKAIRNEDDTKIRAAHMYKAGFYCALGILLIIFALFKNTLVKSCGTEDIADAITTGLTASLAIMESIFGFIEHRNR